MHVSVQKSIFGHHLSGQQNFNAMSFEQEKGAANSSDSEDCNLTPSGLRCYKGLENVTDEEAWPIIETIVTLSKILFEIEHLGKMHDKGKKYERRR